jgi:nucleoside-diphosphate-sugar epimerase
LDSGYRVRVLDSLRIDGQGLFSYFGSEKFEFIKGDVRNKENVKSALRDIDLVIHLAAVVGYPACRKEPKISRDINVNGTKTLVEKVKCRVPIIFASTGSTYGKLIEEICTETTPLHPLSHYGKQKAEAEDIIKTNRKFIIYRFATAFGVSPRMRLDLLPNDFTYQAVHGKTLIVYEKNFMRTFIHVKDMARSFLFALKNYEKMEGEIYNVGNEKLNFSKEEICKLIKKKVDFYLHFAEVGRDLDKRDYYVSYDKIQELGFETSITMEKGIDELIRASEVIKINNPYTNL